MLRHAATYARFSSDLQRDASIADQHALCRRYAERNSLEVVREYADSAKSGASLYGRDALQDMMADAKTGLFQVVLVESLDRLSRDQEDLAGLFKRLSFLGVELLTAHEGKADHIAIGVRGLLGALYLKDLADKTRRGLAGKVAAGQSAGGKAYGYKPVPGSPGLMELVPHEVEVVQRIYREYADGHSARTIAYGLNADRIPAPRGASWNASTIGGTRNKGTGILRVDLYRGMIVWNKMRYIRDPSTGKRVSRPNPKSEWRTAEAPHLRIVDDALWQCVQDRLGETGEKGGRFNRPKTKRLLTGLLKCAVCGSGMAICGTSENRLRIGCSRYRESRSCDHRRTYYLDTAERGVVNVLRHLLADPAALKTFIDSYMTERRRLVADIAKERRRAEGNVAKAVGARDRMLKFLIEGIISKEAYMKERDDLERRVVVAEAELARVAPAPAVDLHPAAIAAYKGGLDHLHDLLCQGTGHGDNAAMKPVRDLIHSVIVHPVAVGKPMRIEIIGQFRVLTGESPAVLVVAGADIGCNYGYTDNSGRFLVSLNTWDLDIDYGVAAALLAA